MGFSRARILERVARPSPGGFENPEIEPASLVSHWQVFFTATQRHLGAPEGTMLA